MESERMLRRSPRTLKSSPSSATEKSNFNHLSPEPAASTMSEHMMLRRSPRTLKFSNSSGTENSSSDQSTRPAASTMPEQKILRRTPRTLKFSPSSASLENSSLNDALLKPAASTMRDPKILRKSPRLLKSSELGSSTMSPEKTPTESSLPLKRMEVESSTCEATQNGSQRKTLGLKSAELLNKDSFKKPKLSSPLNGDQSELDLPCVFVGDPVPMDESQKRWPWRYEREGKGIKHRTHICRDNDGDELVLDVKCHYMHADVAGCIFGLGDCAFVKGVERGANYVGRILEFFETMEGKCYFTVQWFFRAEDTVMKEEAAFHDEKRLFYSDLRNDNLLECIVSKVKIVQITPSIDLRHRKRSIPPCDFYYDMKYSVDYSTFSTMMTDNSGEISDLSSSSCIETVQVGGFEVQSHSSCKSDRLEVALLDLYSGCGAMSTGLCLGAKLSGVNLVTRWAVDFNESACKSLRLNHPGTQVRNETAEDFLELLKEWQKLCQHYGDTGAGSVKKSSSHLSRIVDVERVFDDDKIPAGEYEVSKLVDICYGDPCETGKRGLRFKVRWLGYDPSEDTWELIEELSKCQDRIRDFVREGLKYRILPLPGDVDIICGGPPCQGISGHNRHRNVHAPLDDEKNRQIVIFMDIVKFLQPKHVLMENVVDILKFANGCLGRYALSRLVHMNYQARIGIMAAGCYGLPQFRLRVFLWGAHPYEKLPPFPLPTHDVVLRGGGPTEFKRNIVACDEGQHRELEKAAILGDAISDLPVVTNDEDREEMFYSQDPETEFQRYIRLAKHEMMGSTVHGMQNTRKSVLYDHRPMQLNEDDYMRVCHIPKRKGANFRDLPGVIVGDDNIARLNPAMERVWLPSGKPLVPDYALNFGGGKSLRPFGRLWWDDTVSTVVTMVEPRNQPTIHPEQDRVLTIRECARLQGFPDHYRFCGTVKQRYTQVGNAVAISVSRALGYAFGMAWLKLSGDQPLLTLPRRFSLSKTIQRLPSSSSEV